MLAGPRSLPVRIGGFFASSSSIPATQAQLRIGCSTWHLGLIASFKRGVMSSFLRE